MAHALSVSAAVLGILLTACGSPSDSEESPSSPPKQDPTTDRAAHLGFHRGKLPAESSEATALGVRSTTPLKHPRVGQPVDNLASNASDHGSTTP